MMSGGRTIVIIAVLLAGFGAGYFANQVLHPPPGATGPDDPSAPEEEYARPTLPDVSGNRACTASGLILERSELIRRDDGTVIEGTITKTGTVNITVVNADFALFDRNDTMLGSASVYTDEFPAGGTWEFVAAVMDPEVDSYTLAGICAY